MIILMQAIHFFLTEAKLGLTTPLTAAASFFSTIIALRASLLYISVHQSNADVMWSGYMSVKTIFLSRQPLYCVLQLHSLIWWCAVACIVSY